MYNKNLKPIFHCDAKFLALRVGVGQYPRRQNFAWGIPTCWYLGANANPLICILPDAKPKICVLPDAKPKCKPVEYRLRSVPNAKFSRWPCTFLFFGVDFIRVGSRFFSGKWALSLKPILHFLIFILFFRKSTMLSRRVVSRPCRTSPGRNTKATLKYKVFPVGRVGIICASREVGIFFFF